MNQREEAQEGKGKSEQNPLAAAAARRLKLLKERGYKPAIKSPERMAAEQKAYNDALKAEINARDASPGAYRPGPDMLAAEAEAVHGVRPGVFGYAWTGDDLRSIKGSCRRRRMPKLMKH